MSVKGKSATPHGRETNFGLLTVVSINWTVLVATLLVVFTLLGGKKPRCV